MWPPIRVLSRLGKAAETVRIMVGEGESGRGRSVAETVWRRRAPRAGLAAVALAMTSALAGAALQSQGQAARDHSLPGGGRVSVTDARFAAVVGVAWQSDNTPIVHARVRLRDVSTGRAAGHAVANEVGRFRFEDVLPGSYVVELVNGSGKVLTVGHSFSVARGETVATFVRLGTRTPWVDGFFANAAAAVASAAAAAGVTAIAPESVRPVSATR